jgi:hypothetical protein
MGAFTFLKTNKNLETLSTNDEDSLNQNNATNRFAKLLAQFIQWAIDR